MKIDKSRVWLDDWYENHCDEGDCHIGDKVHYACKESAQCIHGHKPVHVTRYMVKKK